MQLQSTLLFFTTLLAATCALPNSHPKKYNAGEVAYYPGVKAEIQGWAKQSCPAHDKPSYSHTVDQGHCYTLPKTEFLSYKLWQPVHTTAGWDCTFTLYEDPGTCTGFYVAPSDLPSTKKAATCDDGLRHDDGYEKTGFRSFKYTCECTNFDGCVISITHL